METNTSIGPLLFGDNKIPTGEVFGVRIKYVQLDHFNVII